MGASGMRAMRVFVTAVAAAIGLSVTTVGPAAAAPPTRLSVMTFNIFYGGDELDLATGEFCAETDACDETFAEVVKAVRAAGADVVGLQEPERNSRRLARELGWHVSERSHVISRFPILEPPGADGTYVLVEVAPGRVVAVADAHLTSDPYGPYAARDGASAAEVLDLERSTRLAEVDDVRAALPPLAARGVPVFLTGDFNSPSHLDWTDAVAAARPDVPYALDWPVSRALADAGLRDSYREAHPDPVAVPGFTWTPGGPEADPREVFDRIDWVLTAGPSTTVESRTVGEVGGPDVGVGLDPYPSDHRGVVSTFDVVPAAAPELVSVLARRAFVGDVVAVDVRTGGGPRTVVVQRAGRTRADLGAVAGTGARLRLDTSRLAPGAYETLLLDARGQPVARAPLWLYADGTRPTVHATQRAYRVGEPITVTWDAAPGRRLDWVALHRCDPRCGGDYLLYEYTGARITGRESFGPESVAGAATWPLPPGTYQARLLTDDSYRVSAASTTFVVRR